MGATGGSDGDGRGSRYEKDLAAAKIADAKWRESKSGSSVGDAPGGGCLTGLGGCWLASITITTVGILILMVIKLGAMTVGNITSLDIAQNYSTAQYFRNIGHLDRSGIYTVNTKALDCYEEAEDAFDKDKQPLFKLKRGQKFIYHGYQIVDDQTLVAIELERDDPVYCYLLLPEVWTGKSFWDNGETELIIEEIPEPGEQ